MILKNLCAKSGMWLAICVGTIGAMIVMAPSNTKGQNQGQPETNPITATQKTNTLDEKVVLAIVREIEKLQETMAENENKIALKLAEIKEQARLARIFSSRSR